MTADEYTELETRFTYHPPFGTQTERYRELRKQAMLLAGLVYDNCPDSRERSLAITKLEEAVMWGNAAIARREARDFTAPEV